MIQDPVLVNDWHPVARVQDLPEDKILSVRLLGEDLVLWRSQGKPQAWQDLCIHRGARLSLGRIRDGLLMCPYHGWMYDSTGKCVRIPAHPDQVPPARARVRTYLAEERYDLIWVCLGEPIRDIPPFPEWSDLSYRKVFCGPYHYRASGPRAIENFLDVAHFAFVHEGILGDPEQAEIPDYEVQRDSEGLIAKDVTVWQPNANGAGRGAYVKYTYRVLRPLTAYFSKDIAGERRAVFFTITPVEETRSIAWVWTLMNYGYEVPEETFQNYWNLIASQDIPVVESQRPEKLPLDLQTELHLRSDRTSIAYRKWLRELGLTFGTE
jgi:phenylpropionate dioxygenase-like ring-hydroxylating dioxygenase large terminal subunit